MTADDKLRNYVTARKKKFAMAKAMAEKNKNKAGEERYEALTAFAEDILEKLREEAK